MTARFSIIFAVLFCFLFFSETEAQTTLKNGKIPDDLLITLQKQEGWGGTYSEMTINSRGEFSYQSRGGNLPVVRTPYVFSINGKHIKPAQYLKPKLSDEKLKLLIAEFEKIQFFKFGKDFPAEDEKEIGCITDVGTEAISIRINGQTKEVSDYYGCSGKRNRLLRDLAERIRGAGVWNYENGEIPDNFEVWYRITEGGKIQKDFKINSNGKITENHYHYLSKVFPETGKNLLISVKSKKVGKLSKQQIKQLIDEFEKVGFSTFTYSTLTKYAGCLNESASTPEKRKHINVQINYVSQMYASLFNNCNPKPETDAAKFEYMANEIEKLLKTFKTIKMNQ